MHAYIQFIGCLGIAVGLPWSKVPLSLSVVLLALNFILRGDFADVYANFKRKKALWFFLGFVTLELLSILWSSNKSQALSDLNIRAPFYALPFLLIAKPLESRKQIQWVGFAFILACFVTSFINIGSYEHWWGNRVYDDFRGLSLFVSHVRYALLIVFATVLCFAWFIYKLPYRWLAFVLLCWMLFYTYFAQILTGYLALSACLLIGAFLFVFQMKSKPVKLSVSIAFLLIAVAVLTWTYNALQPIPPKVKLENLATHTANGTPYWTVSDSEEYWENGYPIYGLYCPEELEPAWNKRSQMNYDSARVPSGELVSNILHRYLTSKGLSKDSVGVSLLTDDDIANIEKGINSVKQLEGGIQSRLYSINYELQNCSNPNGHSLLERIEYWKAARSLIKKHWLFGLGMGDLQDTFNDYYTKTDSNLLPENRHRAHQMYFTVILSSGILSFILFLLWWWAQIKIAWRLKSLTWLSFIAIAMSSFLIEDTLETQLGGTFVSFFFGLFMAHPKWFMKKAAQSRAQS